MAQAARKVTAKNANEKLAHRRLAVLELAERLGKVAEVPRHRGRAIPRVAPSRTSKVGAGRPA
jgi:hypothetical protein